MKILEENTVGKVKKRALQRSELDLIREEIELMKKLIRVKERLLALGKRKQ